MVQRAYKILCGVSTRFLSCGGKSITILWFFVLTALHVVWLDEGIAADPNVRGPVFFLPQPDVKGFDRELFASNGSNTSEVFNIGHYRQANFRLAQSGGGDFINDWDQFIKLVALVRNTADGIHGIPLLITKVNFTTSGAAIRTFFMTAFSAETIFQRNITILSSSVFQLSADPVVSIQLQVEGATINVPPSGNTPLQFVSAGEKTVRATVRFASGFVGRNLFRVVVQ
jgi:hypothetical protein